MDGHASANQLRLSLPGADRVKPERNLEAAKPPSAKCDPNLRPLVGSSHGTAVYGPVRTVVWEGRSREAPPYPDLEGEASRTNGSAGAYSVFLGVEPASRWCRDSNASGARFAIH